MKSKISSITNIFDVRFIVCGVGVVLNEEDELPIGSNFDDERLFVNDKRLGCSDGNCFVYNDEDVDRVWLLNKLELCTEWIPPDDVLLKDSKLLLELAKRRKEEIDLNLVLINDLQSFLVVSSDPVVKRFLCVRW